MEKKATKTTATTKKAAKTTNTKTAKTTTTKAVVKNECKCVDNTVLLTKIFYSIIALIVISSLTFITVFVKLVNLPSTTTNEPIEEASTEYDVSMFSELTTSEAVEKISDGSKYVVYIGRPTCGYCVKFLPTLQKAQKEYGYKTIYIDLEKMTSQDQTNILKVDNDEKYIAENYGYTPMVLIFENGKLSKGWVGYAEYDKFASFLEDNGFKK